jgi:hypothetical protein
MATPTAARSSSPQFFIAFVAAVGISFIAGEKVGIRLAGQGVAPAPASILVVGGASSDRGEPGLQGAATLRDAEPDGVGADCNTNLR